MVSTLWSRLKNLCKAPFNHINPPVLTGCLSQKMFIIMMFGTMWKGVVTGVWKCLLSFLNSACYQLLSAGPLGSEIRVIIHFANLWKSLAVLELWSEWLKDEMPLACIPEHKEKVITLFERAVKDYQCKYCIAYCCIIILTQIFIYLFIYLQLLQT